MPKRVASVSSEKKKKKRLFTFKRPYNLESFSRGAHSPATTIISLLNESKKREKMIVIIIGGQVPLGALFTALIFRLFYSKTTR